MNAKQTLDKIIELDLQIADLRDQFDDLPLAERESTLRQQLDSACRATGPDAPVSLALVRTTDLVFGLGADGAALLAPALDHVNPDVRHLIGEALIGLAEEGVDQIAAAIEHALAAGGSAAEELPFILALVEDADAPRQIERFLALEQADPVAAAIEALADIGDPDSIPALQRLVDDERTVALDGDEDGTSEIALGVLAREAIEAIELGNEE